MQGFSALQLRVLVLMRGSSSGTPHLVLDAEARRVGLNRWRTSMATLTWSSRAREEKRLWHVIKLGANSKLPEGNEWPRQTTGILSFQISPVSEKVFRCDCLNISEAGYSVTDISHELPEMWRELTGSIDFLSGNLPRLCDVSICTRYKRRSGFISECSLWESKVSIYMDVQRNTQNLHYPVKLIIVILLNSVIIIPDKARIRQIQAIKSEIFSLHIVAKAPQPPLT